MIKTRIGSVCDPAERFFAYAAEREAIRLRREMGSPRPWTDDPILQRYRFCNVFREDDATTRWFAEHVRGPLAESPEVLLATVLFRWFNRVSTGEAVFCQLALYQTGETTAWDEYLRTGKTSVLLHAIRSYCGSGPYVTGAYTVLGRRGMTKLPGCLWGVDQFNKKEAEFVFQSSPPDRGDCVEVTWQGWRKLCDYLPQCGSLWNTWAWLRQFPYLGDFTAYEIVTDLRHTALLRGASDVMTWANAGPGARRGLQRLGLSGPGESEEWNSLSRREQDVRGMEALLLMANKMPWTKLVEDVRMRRWELREVEHTLCEFDKYERTRLGQGRPRGVMR
jgi:hypothetical protein